MGQARSSEPGDFLSAAWSELAAALGVPRLAADATFAELAAAYGAPGRYYHTLEHIAEMLGLLQMHRRRAADPATVQLAVWFHDAVYDSRRSDNEARSADLAADRLRTWGLPAAQITLVYQMILATCHVGTPPADADTQFLIDLDLAILAAQPERYDRYAADIRREFAWVADADYRSGRRRVLEGFLARPRIYSAELWEGQEGQARTNLRRELVRLG
jgi:predicted metal-dependent HD superfamily phosphohydrolase